MKGRVAIRRHDVDGARAALIRDRRGGRRHRLGVRGGNIHDPDGGIRVKRVEVAIAAKGERLGAHRDRKGVDTGSDREIMGS
jgi:hypothetical protein